MPTSRPRHRRRPSPRSYQRARRPQRRQRRWAPLRGGTDTTTASASSSKSIPSMTVPTSPRARCHTLAFRTPFRLLLQAFAQAGTQEAGGVRSRMGYSATHGWIRGATILLHLFLFLLSPGSVYGYRANQGE